jgi:hypothetical protein
MSSLEQVQDIANAAGEAIKDLRELQIAADAQAIGTLAALGVPFGVVEALPEIPWDPTVNPIDASRCSQQGDRTSDSVRTDD